MWIFGKRKKHPVATPQTKEEGRELVSQSQFQELPHLARFAFAARCARRIETYARHKFPTPDDRLDTANQGIIAVERFSVAGRNKESTIGIIKAIGDIADAQHQGLNEGDIPIGLALLVAQYVVTDALQVVSDVNPAGEIGAESVGIINAAFRNLLRNTGKHEEAQNAIQTDFRLLREELETGNWTDSTPVPLDFFPLRSNFQSHKRSLPSRILEIAPRVEERLIAYFKDHPEELRRVHPRRFEEIVAEIFSRFGFSVELTAQTRDGGRDIIAINNSPAALKFLIECKRFTPPNKVGIGVVQRLHGVTMSEGASKGIIATTSYFTDPARQHLEKHPYLLEGRDYEGIREWLKLYDLYKMATFIDNLPEG